VTWLNAVIFAVTGAVILAVIVLGANAFFRGDRPEPPRQPGQEGTGAVRVLKPGDPRMQAKDGSSDEKDGAA